MILCEVSKLGHYYIKSESTKFWLPQLLLWNYISFNMVLPFWQWINYLDVFAFPQLDRTSFQQVLTNHICIQLLLSSKLQVYPVILQFQVTKLVNYQKWRKNNATCKKCRVNRKHLTNMPTWWCLIYILRNNSISYQATFHWMQQESLQSLPSNQCKSKKQQPFI